MPQVPARRHVGLLGILLGVRLINAQLQGQQTIFSFGRAWPDVPQISWLSRLALIWRVFAETFFGRLFQFDSAAFSIPLRACFLAPAPKLAFVFMCKSFD